MDYIDDVIENNKIRMRELLSNHIIRMQEISSYYKRPTIYEPKISDRQYNQRCESSRSSSTSSSCDSSSSSNAPTLLPLLLEGKNADILRVVNNTLQTVDKTLGKQLRKTKNKKAVMFKILLVFRRLFDTLKRPMYTALGVIGVYTSIAHFFYLPDTIYTFLVSSTTIKDMLYDEFADDC